jgi:5-formyltetrahydrofolate cyclo-ligase
MTKIKAKLRKEHKPFDGDTPSPIVSSAQRFIEGSLVLVVGLYIPMNSEPDLTPLINNNPHIKFSIPKIIDDNLVFAEYHLGDSLGQNPGFSKIQEPVNTNIVMPDLIFVPGLAFDLRGYRLGRGGGYYDKYIASHPKIQTIGISFGQNLLESLPREKHDRKMQYIITEHMVLQT